MTSRFITGCALAAVTATAAAAGDVIAQTPRQQLDTTFAFRDGTVEVRSLSGAITIRTWNRREAKISAWVERGELVRELSPSRIRLEARPERGRSGSHEFVLTVPVGTRVEARAMSGDVSVSGTRGPVSIESMSGDVSVEDASDRVDAVTMSGEVRGARLSGNVFAKSVSGDIALREIEGALVAESVSGDLDITASRASSLRAETISGDVRYDGPLDAKGRYELKSHAGGLILRIPDGSRADISARTFSGEIASDFAVVVEPSGGRSSGRRERMRIQLGGGGGAAVHLESFSGSIILRRHSASPTSRED